MYALADNSKGNSRVGLQAIGTCSVVTAERDVATPAVAAALLLSLRCTVVVANSFSTPVLGHVLHV